MEHAKKQRYLWLVSQATLLVEKVGSNDPCPCGGEKKYKSAAVVDRLTSTRGHLLSAASVTTVWRITCISGIFPCGNVVLEFLNTPVVLTP